jgi:putative transposase
MPRRARIVLPGLPIHVVQRGNNRSACFFSDGDRRFYLHHLQRLSAELECDVHAYCLMTNHVHLLLSPHKADSCARLMRRLDLLHSQYMNRKYHRTGSLWEGRFRSCIVESETYLLHCYTYIERNPVRAALAKSPAEYQWSSYGSNGLGVENALLTPHSEYLRLGRESPERCESYRNLFAQEECVAKIREATNGNFVLGSESFIQNLSNMLGVRVTRGRPGRPARSVTSDQALELPG